MTISELYRKKQINLRIHNICIDNDLYTFDEVKDHYLRYRTFSNLKKCGKKSNTELIDAYLSLRKSIENPEVGEKCIIDSIEEMKPSILSILNQFIEVSFFNLSNRAQKSICLYMGMNPNLAIFKEKILTRSFNIFNLQNVGQKTIKEIILYLEQVIGFIELLDDHSANEKMDNKIDEYLKSSIYPLNTIPENILSTGSIFRLVKFLLDNDFLFSKKENLVFQKTNYLFSGENPLKYEDLALQLGMTVERIRNMRRVSLEKLGDKIQFVSFVKDETLEKFRTSKVSEINIDSEFQKKINRDNETDFSIGFIAILLSVYLSDYYNLEGQNDNKYLAKILTNPTLEGKIYKLTCKN